MNTELENAWEDTVTRISKAYGEKLDYTTILFLIGVQELKCDFRKFKKNEKLDLIHIGICSVLQPLGYYQFIGKDEEGWPHFERTEKLNNLTASKQDEIIKQAIITYFEQN